MSEPPLTFSLPDLIMKPGDRLDITLQDGTVVHAQVTDVAPPSNDGSFTYTVTWEKDE